MKDSLDFKMTVHGCIPFDLSKQSEGEALLELRDSFEDTLLAAYPVENAETLLNTIKVENMGVVQQVKKEESEMSEDEEQTRAQALGIQQDKEWIRKRLGELGKLMEDKSGALRNITVDVLDSRMLKFIVDRDLGDELIGVLGTFLSLGFLVGVSEAEKEGKKV